MKDDYIVRGIGADGYVRAFGALTTNTVQRAYEIHQTAPVVSAALGRMMTVTLMMGAMLKGEKDLITTQIKSQGPIQGMVVTANPKGQVKGYPFEPNVFIPTKAPGKLDVGAAVGPGRLSVIKDLGLKEPYVGQVELTTGEIGDDFAYYFANSEQTPSVVGLGVLVDVDHHIKQSGGFLIQLMPNAPEHIIDMIEKNIQGLKHVTQWLEEGHTIEDVLSYVLAGLDFKPLEKTPAAFYCNCSKQRVEKALVSIGVSGLEDILKEDGQAALHCHFCGQDYIFDETDLKALIGHLKGESK